MKLIFGLTAISIGLVAAVVFGMGGCHDSPSSNPSTGAKLSFIEDLNPTLTPGKKATVVLAGSKFNVDLTTKSSTDTFEIELTKHSETVDHEIYRFSPSGFSIERAAGETYSPAIPLLRFPMVIGDSWAWQGTMSSGQDILPAKGTITTDMRSEYVGDQPVQAVVVLVELVIGEHKPIKREIAFHFAKDHGLFRREFGETSVREPLEQ